MNTQKGMAFLTSLILLGIIVLLCSAISLMVLRDTYTITRIKSGMQAYFLAEAGIEEALKELTDDFNWSPPGSKSLGAGTYILTITNSTDSTRKLITSTGTVGAVSRIIKVQVRNNIPPAFTYAMLSGGQTRIWGWSTINGDIHANSTLTSVLAPAMSIGLLLPSTVNGGASACGRVRIYNGSVNPGPPVDNAPAVPLPNFDDAFFNYYYNLANADGKAYSTSQTFNSDQCTGSNHVIYVNGNITLNGSWSTTGCYVATGNITINGAITQLKYQNLPAFMSKNGNISISNSLVSFQGMVYAGNTISVSIALPIGRFDSTGGCLYARNDIRYRGNLTYQQPHPPGMFIPTGINIESWNQ
ncbi:MAG: hypothetical protein NC828_05455 [Candidatus Omnitrophica bacterium]|nr:hypothetical protein [Candidatus Omnitrophota bacterium]